MFVLAASDIRAQSSSQPFFMELPPNVLPYAVGANGWLSVGLQYQDTNALYWTPATGAVEIGGIVAIASSRDGRTVAGNAFDAQLRQNAAIWTGGTAWRRLGSFTPNAKPCDTSYSSSYGINGDGTVIVGLGWDGCTYAHAFRWTEQTGVVDLGTLNGRSTRANGVSADGRVVVGWGTDVTGVRLGAKWVDGKQQMITNASNRAVGEAFAANADGSILAGTNCDFFAQPAVVPTGWTWTADKGVQCLPVTRPSWVPPAPYNVLVQAMSDDGRVMVGSYTFGLDAQSLLWLDGQVYFLRDYLRANGYPSAFSDWINTGFLTGVTPDGRTLVGYGAGPKTFQGYMVVLPDRGQP
jgi:probable HAF family extracellular repeat protein